MLSGTRRTRRQPFWTAAGPQYTTAGAKSTIPMASAGLPPSGRTAFEAGGTFGEQASGSKNLVAAVAALDHDVDLLGEDVRHDPGVDHRKSGGAIRAIRHGEAQLVPFTGNASGYNGATHTQGLTSV